jgi:hypothetical protein
MFLNAQRLRKANTDREGVNVALWKHHEAVPRTDDGKIDLEFVATLNPGRYEAEHVDLAPGRNPVLAFLDIAAEDTATKSLIERALSKFAETIREPQSVWLDDGSPEIAVRFGGASHYFLTREPRQVFDELRQRALSLFTNPTKPKWTEGDPIEVRARREENRTALFLADASRKRVSGLGGQPWGNTVVSIEQDVWENFAAMFGEVFPHIIPTLTGLPLEDLASLGGVVVRRDSDNQVLWRWPKSPEEAGKKTIFRNFTGLPVILTRTPDGKLDELPIESRRFFMSNTGQVMTHDEEQPLAPRPFTAADLPRPRSGVKLLVRPEVFRHFRNVLKLERTDLTDGVSGA